LKTNKAIGLDKKSARLLKDSAEFVAPVVTGILNRSLESGVFPAVWKNGKVSALFKSGNRSECNNYRPITVLPTVSKILERAVHQQFYSYLTESNILTPKQIGFHPKLSTEVALAHFTDSILEKLNKGMLTGAVFLDLSKAFDTVNHDLLLAKLNRIGACKSVVQCFTSYLSNRFQLTTFGNVESTLLPVHVGVPLGSILGPLLFLVYINNLAQCLEHCEVALYADDTVIYFSSLSVGDIESALNEDLATLFMV